MLRNPRADRLLQCILSLRWRAVGGVAHEAATGRVLLLRERANLLCRVSRADDALARSGSLFQMVRGVAMIEEGVVLICGSIVAEVPTAGVSTVGVVAGISLIVMGGAAATSGYKGLTKK